MLYCCSFVLCTIKSLHGPKISTALEIIAQIYLSYVSAPLFASLTPLRSQRIAEYSGYIRISILTHQPNPLKGVDSQNATTTHFPQHTCPTQHIHQSWNISHWQVYVLGDTLHLKSQSPILVTKLKRTFQTFQRKVCILSHNNGIYWEKNRANYCR